MSNLSPSQQKFLNNLMSGNYRTQGQAYSAAGYDAVDESAEVNACNLLKNANFRRAYEKALSELAKKTGITKERVLEEERRLAYMDPGDLFEIKSGQWTPIPPPELPEDVRRAISSIDITENYFPQLNKVETKYKYKFWDKGRALERVSRHLGLYDDKITIGIDDKLLEFFRAVIAILPNSYAVELKGKLIKLHPGAQKLLSA